MDTVSPLGLRLNDHLDKKMDKEKNITLSITNVMEEEKLMILYKGIYNGKENYYKF